MLSGLAARLIAPTMREESLGAVAAAKGEQRTDTQREVDHNQRDD